MANTAVQLGLGVQPGEGQQVFDFETELGTTTTVDQSWDMNTPEFLVDWDDSAIQLGSQLSSNTSSCTTTPRNSLD